MGMGMGMGVGMGMGNTHWVWVWVQEVFLDVKNIHTHLSMRAKVNVTDVNNIRC